jgi:hypothetical protein
MALSKSFTLFFKKMIFFVIFHFFTIFVLAITFDEFFSKYKIGSEKDILVK